VRNSSSHAVGNAVEETLQYATLDAHLEAREVDCISGAFLNDPRDASLLSPWRSHLRPA
jgi:hypothetical protein